MRPAIPLSPVALAALLALGACEAANNIRTPKPEDALQPGDTITVMSFNIRVGYGTEDWGRNPYELRHGPEKLDPIIAAIRSADPDVVGLQEVLADGQAARIAGALDLNYAFAPHPSNRPWWGVAVLSKFPITSASARAISSGAGNSKSVSIAEVDVGRKGIVFASVHKDVDLTDGGSFRRLKSAVEGTGLPTVLIGDFNVQPGDRRFDLLGGDFLDTAEVATTPGASEARSAGTWGMGYGYRIDYVLVRGSEFEVVDAGLVPQEHRGASDHYASFAVVKPKF